MPAAKPTACARDGTIARMTEPLAVDQQLEEIGARLAWVRDYL
jgi:hypothetical protein